MTSPTLCSSTSRSKHLLSFLPLPQSLILSMSSTTKSTAERKERPTCKACRSLDQVWRRSQSRLGGLNLFGIGDCRHLQLSRPPHTPFRSARARFSSSFVPLRDPGVAKTHPCPYSRVCRTHLRDEDRFALFIVNGFTRWGTEGYPALYAVEAMTFSSAPRPIPNLAVTKDTRRLM